MSSARNRRRPPVRALDLARLASFPLGAGSLALVALIHAHWAWRTALHRAAVVDGSDPASLIAEYPLTRVCGDPVSAFASCATVTAATGVVALAVAIVAALLAVLVWSTVATRRVVGDPERLAQAAGTSLTVATTGAAAAMVAGAGIVHLASAVYGPRIAGGIRAVVWAGCALGLVRLAVALLARPDAGEPPVLEGVALQSPEAPRLFALIEDVAAQLHVRPPDHVVASIDGGCFVARGPFLCGGEHLYGVTLHLAVPWCLPLSPDELRSVIAHELAHVGAGDLDRFASLLPVLDRVGRVHAALAVPPATHVVGAFGLGLGSTLEPIRREQEVHADSIAARVAGPRAAASAVMKVALARGLPAEGEAERVVAMGADPRIAAADAARLLDSEAWTLGHDVPGIEERATAAAMVGRPAQTTARRWLPPEIAWAELARLLGVLVVAGVGVWLFPSWTVPAPTPTVPHVEHVRAAEVVPDTIQLLDDLRAGRFEALEAAMADAVRRARTSPADEMVSEVALRGFETGDPTLAARLDQWVARMPGSVVALAARAQYRSKRGWDARGSAYAVSPAQRGDMLRWFDLATADARAALKRDSDLVEADIVLLGMAPVTGNCDTLATAALAKHPASYRLRSLYLHCLLPRWRGSYRDMRAFTLAALRHAPANPRLTALGGLLDWDAGRLASADGRDDAALAYYARALAYGPEAQVYRARAIVYTRRNDYPRALDDLDAALRLRPADADLIRRRASMLAATGRFEAAGEAALRAQRLDPAMPALEETRRYVTQHLLREGDASGRRGDLVTALRLLQPVLLLEPGNHEACRRVVYILGRTGRSGEADATARACTVARTP